MRGIPSWLAWGFALFELIRTITMAAMYLFGCARDELDGTNQRLADWEAQRKKEEADRLEAIRREADEEQRQREERYREWARMRPIREAAKKAAEEEERRLAEEKRAALEKLWATTAPKSRKWDFKI